MYYLGVDGGGTKTAFMLINEKGKIIAYRELGTCHHQQIGWEQFRLVLAEGIAAVTIETGIDCSDLDWAFFGLPGFGEEPAEIPVLENTVRLLWHGRGFRCGNDAEAGWAGALGCAPGINLIGGTGAMGFGKDQLGNERRVGGWGHNCGDEGSAYWLGKQLLSLFGKEADGREEKTALYDLVRQKFSLRDDFELISMVSNKLQMKREKIAELALLVYQAAVAGDPKAIALYEEAAYEYGLIVKALLNQLEFDPMERVFVSYTGGVFMAGDYILKPLAQLLIAWPVILIPPRLQPVTGAALYALNLAQTAIDPGLVSVLQEEEQRVLGK